MDFNGQDPNALLMSFLNAQTSLSTSSSVPKTDDATATSVQSRVEKLETQMHRIELKLNKILNHLNLSVEDEDDAVNSAGFDKLTLTPETSTYPGRKEPEERQAIEQDINARYTYTSLDTTKAQIRILRLHQAKEFSDPLVADLVVVGMDDESLAKLVFGYTALSYTWGPPVFDGLILVDGYRFPITQSLEDGLRRLLWATKDNVSIELNGRIWGKECYCWVDQICINQSDIDERGDQVGLMRRIYKRATSVNVWLGEEADDSSMAIDLLNTLGAPPKHAPGERTIHYPSFPEEKVMSHWNALRALFKRPWWERVWIRQEIALNYTVKFWCGGKSFEMATLAPALFMLKYISSLGYASTISHSDDNSTVSLPWDFHPRTLVELRHLTGSGASWVSPAQLLRITRSCKATDARDMVFSVLGMIDPETYPLVSNYRLGMNQVLRAAAEATLGLEFGLELLGACQNPERTHGLPSWTPYLVDKWKAMPFRTIHMDEQRFIHRLTDSQLPNVEVNGETLTLQGEFVDTVHSICPTFIQNNASVESMEFTYASWKRFAESASVEKKLTKDEVKTYIQCELPREKLRNWIRFLTVLYDDAEDLQEYYSIPLTPKDKQDNEMFAGDPMKHHYQYLGLNRKLSSCYLIPSSYQTANTHPNRRMHVGFQLYGVGRRLCITKRGFLGLIPAEAQVGDPIAIFGGATFPYVLRRSKEGDDSYVLVGEAFVPSWAGSLGERKLDDFMQAWRITRRYWIQLR